MAENEAIKPPIGVVPRYLNDEKRMRELCIAISKYASNWLVVNPEWVEEYNDLVRSLKERDRAKPISGQNSGENDY